MHEAPRHEPGYIEEVGHDDIFDEHVWARQILTALPDAHSYDVYPDPYKVVKPEPAPA